MGTVTKQVNLIRARALNHRQFRNFLCDLDTEYPDLVMFNSVRWLSRGAMLKRFSSMVPEIKSFLSSIGKDCSELDDATFLLHLGILTDITVHLQDLNLKLQGKDKLIFQLVTHVLAFQDLLCLFVAQAENCDFTQFPTVAKFATDTNSAKEKLLCCLQSLQQNFEDRFSDFLKMGQVFLFVENPFVCKSDCTFLPSSLNINVAAAQREFVELKCNAALKLLLKEDGPLLFWTSGIGG